MSNTEQDHDQAMIDQMFKDAGQHLLIKELVLQVLISQMKEVGVDIDPTPGRMKMVNFRAEAAEREVAALKQKLEAGAVFPATDTSNMVVTVGGGNRNAKIQQPLTAADNSSDWVNGDHNAFVESFKVQDHASVEAVKEFDFTSPEAAHNSQELADQQFQTPRPKRKPEAQHFPIQPLEASPIKYRDDEEYDD